MIIRINGKSDKPRVPHILSFSGGKDSTALLFMLLEKGYPLDRVICVDTTKEFPGMYDHIRKVQDKLVKFGLQIEIN